MELSIPALATEITTEAQAYAFLEELRWNGKPVCPHCGSIAQHYFLTPQAPDGRKTRTGSVSQRRVWACKDCRKQFSVLTGTMMHGTKIPVRTWLFVVFEVCSSKNGVAAREIQRKYHLTPKSAWFLLHRIREAMTTNNGSLFAGDVVADETYIGGEPKNRHGNNGKSKRGRGTDKTPVVSLIDVTTGEVRSRVVPTVSGATLRKAIAENVDMAVATLHSDSLSSYTGIGADMAGHHVVDHSAGQYVTEKSHGTNQAENFFSQLKRSLDGTFHHVSPQHLSRYLSEFDYRHSTREMTDSARMHHLMGITGGTRLMYSHSS